MIRNKKGSEAIEASLLLIIKIVIAVGIVVLMAYLLHNMFGVGMGFG